MPSVLRLGVTLGDCSSESEDTQPSAPRHELGRWSMPSVLIRFIGLGDSDCWREIVTL